MSTFFILLIFVVVFRYIVVGALNDSQFAKLCSIIKYPQLATDELYKTNPLRVKNRKELISKLMSIFKTKSTQEWLTILEVGKFSMTFSSSNNSFDFSMKKM